MNHPYEHTELFIGGDADGRRITLPKGYFPYYMVIEPNIMPHPSYDNADELATSKAERYRREELRCGKSVYEFYVLDSMTTGQAIVKLLNRYKRP